MVLPHKGTQKQGWAPVVAQEVAGGEEVVFRLVRGILNKITPEKFDTLVHQLVNVGIDNEPILQGIIELLFEKALDEPHFSSLYAQVCLVLSRESPSFEQPDLRGYTETSTFIKLLLRNCQDEFEKRTKLCALLSERKKDGAQNDEENMSARKKMLGNIKFIGELGKLELVSEKILHKCIQQLLIRKENPYPEDLECLCGLLRVVGKRLDHEKAKAHIDAYFARMQEILHEELPSRIRFMMQDIMELRTDQWHPRHGTDNGPRKIQDIRREAARKGLGSQKSGGADKHDSRESRFHGDFEPNSSFAGDVIRADRAPILGASSPLPADSYARMGNMPKFAVGDEVSLRPNGSRKTGAPAPPPADVISPTSRARGNARRKTAEKPELTAEQLVNRTERLLEELFGTCDVAEAVRCVEDLSSPAHASNVVEKTVNMMLDRKEEDRLVAASFIEALYKGQMLDSTKFLMGLRPILQSLQDLSIDIPLASQHLAVFCARTANSGIVAVRDFFQPLSPPLDAFFCAQMFSTLRATVGDEKLKEIYAASRVDLLMLSPVCDEDLSSQQAFLAKFDLEFLYPLLKVKQDVEALLAEHVARGPGVAAAGRAFAKILKEKLSADLLTLPKFVKTLASTFFEYATSQTTMSAASAQAPTKEDREAEKDMFNALMPILARYTADNEDAQCEVIYALQVFCHSHRPPKGLIVRVSKAYLYDMDVVEDSAWMRWREEICEDAPGKGDALVELNEFLNWIETAESEEEDD